jgi:hypothetical protein
MEILSLKPQVKKKEREKKKEKKINSWPTATIT